MLPKCLSYIVFVSCWGCYRCSMYYNYMHLGHFSSLFLMLSCTENWAKVSEWRQSQLLSLKSLFKACKSQQIFKNLSISLKIYFKIIMPVETTKCEAWLQLDGWEEPRAFVSLPTPQRLLSDSPSPSAAPLSRLRGRASRASNLQFNSLLLGKQGFLSSNWSLIKDLPCALWFLSRNHRNTGEQSRCLHIATKNVPSVNWWRSSSCEEFSPIQCSHICPCPHSNSPSFLPCTCSYKTIAASLFLYHQDDFGIPTDVPFDVWFYASTSMRDVIWDIRTS